MKPAIDKDQGIGAFLKKHMLLLLLLTQFCSCTTTRVISIEVLNPADIFLEADDRKICLLNPSPANGTDTSFSSSVSDYQSYIKVFKPDQESLSKACIEGFQLAADNAARIEVVGVDSSFRKYRDSLLKKDIPPKEYLSLLSRFTGADLFAILKKFDVYDDVDVIQSANGKYYGEQIVLIYNEWLLYDHKDNVIVDTYKFTDTSYFYGDENIFGFLAKSRVDRRDGRKEAARWAGSRYCKRISPVWYEDERFYYSGSNELLKKASTFISENKWDDAALIWQTLSRDKSATLASKAAFNLALAAEINGEYDLALYWINFSDSLRYRPNNTNYKELIQERIEEAHTLDKQLNSIF